MKKRLVLFLCILALTGCAPARLALTLVPSATPAPSATSVPTAMGDIYPPFDPNVRGDTGCDQYTATLPIADGQGLKQAAIVRKLMESYLHHYLSPEMYAYCRILDYKILDVAYDQRIAFLAQEQQVDFVFWTYFSVQIPIDPSMWVAGNGESGPLGWINSKENIIGLVKSDLVYTLKRLGTGP